MGWLSLWQQDAAPPRPISPSETSRVADSNLKKQYQRSSHIEHATNSMGSSQASQQEASCNTTLDSDLPWIDPQEVARSAGSDPARKLERIWIVIGDIVYDCTDFQHSHPGGETVIQSFNGQDCTWQFWRFHSKRHLEEFGDKLRIGRTKGVPNRYQEQPRYVGLRRLGDEW
ncbi:fatty acid desaturase [Xylogone sp. PMI_703]|nr:fatty acid desaturase [Xylogone sp. PMI_703]